MGYQRIKTKTYWHVNQFKTVMFQAILFDSDGVLIDSERLFFEATRDAFESAGSFISRGQWATWYLSEGKRSREIAGLVGIPSSRLDEIIARRDKLFWDQIDRGAPLLPGVAETLDHLDGQFRLAVVTGASRKHYDRVHASTNLRDYFEVMVTKDECEHVKPHPEAYLTALHKLSLKPCECLAVEDSPRGATAALKAGIPCVVIPTGLTDIALCPEGCRILHNISCLKDLLEKERPVA